MKYFIKILKIFLFYRFIIFFLLIFLGNKIKAVETEIFQDFRLTIALNLRCNLLFFYRIQI